MRGSSGVYLRSDRGDRRGAVMATLVSDVALLDASLTVYQAISGECHLTGTRQQTGVLISCAHPADASRLSNVIQAISRVLDPLSLVCGDSVRQLGGRMRLRNRAILSALRLLACTVLFGRHVSLRPVCIERSTTQAQETRASTARLLRTVDLVSRVLKGRLITFAELSSCLARMGEMPGIAATRIAVDALSIAGRLKMLPGVYKDSIGRARCARCGSRSELHYADRCERCGSRCPVCLCCSSLGLITSCTWLLHVPSSVETGVDACSPRQLHAVTLDIPFPLTKAQKSASRRVQQFVLNTTQKEFLVWAACGSGKTEVVCSAIALVLNRGGTVLYVVPRQSAASDIHGRLDAFFRGVRVGLQSGARRVAARESRFTVCTAHQTLRLMHFADLVVFDEVDAYPCVPGGFLERSVKRSLLPKGKIVYLTATPDREMFGRIRRGLLPFCLISTRHHGMPVPIPQLLIGSGQAALRRLWAGSSGISGDVSYRCLLGATRDASVARGADDRRTNLGVARFQCMRQVVRRATSFRQHELCLLCMAALNSSPTIVFAPSIALVEHARCLLRDVSEDCMPGATWGFCHSKRPDYEEAIQGLKTGQIKTVVTTTVLERGVTISGVDVVVMRADSPVFDSRSLVQMAGRAGRTSDCPTGRVYFAVDEVTRQVEMAIKMIQFMNERLIR